MVSTANPRVLIISDSYLFGGRILDATRYSFAGALSEVSEKICFFHANSYTGEKYEEKLESTIKAFRPNLIIAMNSGCLRQSLIDYAAQKQICILTWFWDSPVLFGYDQNQLAKQTTVFISDITYKDQGGLDGTGEWMPFSSIPAVPYKRNPSKDVCFQGTLWSNTRILQDIAFGLVCETDGKFYFGSALHKALTNGLDTASTWKSPTTNTVYSYGMLLNALSALKRAKTLAWFALEDLHIYGDTEWLSYLWPIAPELLEKCHYLEAQSHGEMRTLFSEYRCSLNVFHLQNKLGGPNLRILDSATHFAPILSDYNQHCHELYPHGEAAFYFRSCDEALEGLHRILKEPGYGENLANEAARILNAGHTHHHRIQTMFQAAQLKYEKTSEACPIEIVSETLPADLFSNSQQSSFKLDPALALPYSNPSAFGLKEREEFVQKSEIAKTETWLIYQASGEYAKFFSDEYQKLLRGKEAVDAELEKARQELGVPLHVLFADRLKKMFSGNDR